MTNPDNTPETPPGATAVQPPAAAAGAKPGVLAAIAKMVAKLRDKLHAWGTFTAPPSHQKKTSNDLAQQRTYLAARRTLMAADRSLMAWIRTGLSMISFGFTIYKILQGFEESGAALGKAAQPRVVGLFLIGGGILSILLGAMEYWQRAQEVSAYGDVSIWRPSFLMAALISVLSVLLFVGVIFKVL